MGDEGRGGGGAKAGSSSKVAITWPRRSRKLVGNSQSLGPLPLLFRRGASSSATGNSASIFDSLFSRDSRATRSEFHASYGLPPVKDEPQAARVKDAGERLARLGRALLQRDYYFSAGVLFGEVADRFGDLVQAVTPIDDRGYFSGCH